MKEGGLGLMSWGRERGRLRYGFGDVYGFGAFGEEAALLKEDLKRWNREVFRRVEIRLATLMEELQVLESKETLPGLSEWALENQGHHPSLRDSASSGKVPGVVRPWLLIRMPLWWIAGSLLLPEDSWPLLFRRGAQDWELEAFVEFFRLLQEVQPINQEIDKWRWKRQGKGSITVSSFYHSLTGLDDPTSP
ncbi:hypothetical protein Acr_24g0009860 [Actinidia rufa]|uniref:Uncharacterized protein n=1 Tax=Actinidia rufa TaxID=165716 RepID=A0A7J0GVI3_9ERIC|nr:hypothetical protein Acr_24g0009860 [Actinidia rufa]